MDETSLVEEFYIWLIYTWKLASRTQMSLHLTARSLHFSICVVRTQGLLDYLRHLGKSTSWKERRGSQASAVGAGEAPFFPRDSSPSFPVHPESREAVAVKITAGLPTDRSRFRHSWRARTSVHSTKHHRWVKFSCFPWFILCVRVWVFCLHGHMDICVCTPHIYVCLQRTEEGSRCPETASWRFMGHDVGAGIWIQVLCKRNHTRNHGTTFPASVTDLLKHVLLACGRTGSGVFHSLRNLSGLFVNIYRFEGYGLWGPTPQRGQKSLNSLP